ncbi:hypothetical protein A3D00_02610 [Candidatus Woesebacteria bacterium RIFCSPHIGHO2_02_FULL_38_9]|uniref:Inositol monophosphatase n=1 Tax=Candidatus Woesebacteria bacterium RIFCSPHIGHO2_01_FULL_39_28 TaxID=1802496 RepID=A0A1F7YGW1_9BACT|nr:MAG: hypothetical protein A2627_01635 [Candidatus Woesebacteria bacterium RIFCSPHIGHO2_01_FULL_39_28]OGM35066.1 MAG: hypothetical protein A3D00_02610 [Candidatus Woesebacteria bacterium RIFCSPHIGHO2_02_FULL_38_9]OGM56888.1 MAG: hypothetical protein A3A50_04020 [Candidatus Woesebacteria bacterium RIFCSPLOWO2_01_FULL_38_20]
MKNKVISHGGQSRGEYLTFAKQLALKSGDIMLKYFQVGLESKVKNDKSIVSVADEEINQLVIDEVSKEYPDFSVFGEEGSVHKKSNFVWVCDPLDGTVPFVKGLPVSVFSLALVEDGKPIVGVVYDPFTKRLYCGTLGGGATLNDSSIIVSNKILDRQATIDSEWYPNTKFDFDPACHELSFKTGVYVLHIGSTINAACMVASGQLEAMIFDGSEGKNVDIAAVKVIVEEAGGKVTDLFGNEQRYDQAIKGAIVSNGIVHDQLINLVEV